MSIIHHLGANVPYPRTYGALVGGGFLDNYDKHGNTMFVFGRQYAVHALVAQLAEAHGSGPWT